MSEDRKRKHLHPTLNHWAKRVRDEIQALPFTGGESEHPADEPETWWLVGGAYPGVSVSTLGRVHTGRKICKQQRFMHGYCVNVYMDGKKTAATLLKLMTLAFFSPLRPGFSTIHVDRDSFNNKLSNLKYQLRADYLREIGKTKRRTIIATDSESNRRIFSNRIEAASWLGVCPATVDKYIERQLKILHETRTWTFSYLKGIGRNKRRAPLFPDADWREISEFPDYECSDKGEVRRKLSKYAMHLSVWSNYYHVHVTRDGTYLIAIVHRLICSAFHGPPPTSKHEVNHLNEDKLDNRAENLEWTLKNTEYSMGIPCERLLPDGSWESFPSSTSAALAVNRTPAAVRAVLKGRSKTCAGYVWRIAE